MQYKSSVLFSCLAFLLSSIVVLGIYYKQRFNDKSSPITISSNATSKSPKHCKMVDFIGDGFCDEETNNELCDFDNGDCCDLNNDRTLCPECFCYTSKIDLGDCSDYNYECTFPFTLYFGVIDDGICDDYLNKKQCYFDGGDCCLDDKDESICNDCTCIQSNLTCVQDELGDGICQDYNNFSACDYDLDDCCPEQFTPPLKLREQNDCCDCSCKHKYYLFDMWQRSIIGENRR